MVAFQDGCADECEKKDCPHCKIQQVLSQLGPLYELVSELLSRNAGAGLVVAGFTDDLGARRIFAACDALQAALRASHLLIVDALDRSERAEDGQ